MTIKFRCSHCQKVLTAPSEKAGVQTNCPGCKQTVQVPAMSPQVNNAGWHYVLNGQQRGPVSAADLKQLARSGELKQDDLVWKEGTDKWVPARSVKGLLPPAASPSPPPLPPSAMPVAADSEELVPSDQIELVPDVLPLEASPRPEPPAIANSSGFWGFVGKVKQAAQTAKENVLKANEGIQKVTQDVWRPTSSTSAPQDAESGLHTLESLGFGSLLAKTWLICQNCKTKLKLPPPAWGRRAICPSCKRIILVPLNDKLRDDLIRELGVRLHLNLTSPTIQHALAHAVDVLYPSATGGTLSFLQLKVLADEIRQNSVKKALEEGRLDQLIEGQLKVNLNDPLVAAAGTPWKLFLWFVDEQFGGCHSSAYFEGSVGHSNPEVNSAYFILQNNLAYEDDPCTKFTTTMLENLLKMAVEHKEAVVRQQEAAYQEALLQQQIATQEAMRDAAYEQASAARQQQYQQQYQQQPSSPSPAPASSTPQNNERPCASCIGKGWQNIGTSSERRCPNCGGQGVTRY